uniref:Uncharacterized protein n=1 Tax=Aegilops tauschii subsp. strangulata TaxID=200361 RepID=A0A453Q1A9_AEGTS
YNSGCSSCCLLHSTRGDLEESMTGSAVFNRKHCATLDKKKTPTAGYIKRPCKQPCLLATEILIRGRKVEHSAMAEERNPLHLPHH